MVIVKLPIVGYPFYSVFYKKSKENCSLKKFSLSISKDKGSQIQNLI